MKRSNYHTLPVLKTACPKLRKAIISNCKKNLINSINECVLNVLKGNITLSDYSKRKLKKYKSRHRSLVDKRLPLSAKKRVIVQHGGFLLPLLTAVLLAVAILIFSKRATRNNTMQNVFGPDRALGCPRDCFPASNHRMPRKPHRQRKKGCRKD
jgi:hypothetical protein